MDSMFVNLFHKFMKSALEIGNGLGFGLVEGLGLYFIIIVGGISSTINRKYDK